MSASIFPRRQWQSRLGGYPGGVGAGMVENAGNNVPLPGQRITGFSYSPSSLVLASGNPMTPAAPIVLPAGVVPRLFKFSAKPPAGLSFNKATGIISGTPTTIQAPTQYTVRADSDYSYFTTITIQVT